MTQPAVKLSRIVPSVGQPLHLVRVYAGRPRRRLESRRFADSRHGGPEGSREAAEAWAAARAAELGAPEPAWDGRPVARAAGLFAGVAGYLLRLARLGLRPGRPELERLESIYAEGCRLAGEPEGES